MVPRFTVIRVVFSVLTALPITVLSAQSAFAEPIQFTLINGTSRDLEEFYVSPPSESSWEEDILGIDVLPSGESAIITIDDGREDCLYDIQGVLGPAPDGSVGRGALVQSSVPLCDGVTYTYTEN